ncbi:MAG: glycosyltransferase family 1 protein [Acidimicrobiia bacterium]
MRVLLDVSAVPERPVGAGVYTVNLAKALDERSDIDLTLLTRRADASRWSTIAPAARLDARLPAVRPLRLAAEQMVRAADEDGLDVWHGPHYTMPWFRSSPPAVVTVHDLTFFDHPEWHERSKVAFFRRAIRASAERAQVVVTPSETTARRLRDLVHPSADVVTIPHGVDHDRFHPDPAVEDADLEVLRGIGVHPPFVAFAGTLEPRKDVPTLVDAFARIAPGHPDLRLVLAGGDGWGANAVRRAVGSSGFTTRIVRPGYVDDAVLPALYRRAAAVAYPSLEEGFGLPVLEALACGAPTVTTRGTSMADVAGDAALLVDRGATDRLAAALETCLTDRGTEQALRERGPHVAAAHTWAVSTAAHVEAYSAAAARVGSA